MAGLYLPGERELEESTQTYLVFEICMTLCVATSPIGVVMKMRERCYTGTLKDTPTKVKKGFSAMDLCIPRVSDTYHSQGLLQPITDKKMEDLKQMIDKFIQVDCWPDFLRSV